MALKTEIEKLITELRQARLRVLADQDRVSKIKEQLVNYEMRIEAGIKAEPEPPAPKTRKKRSDAGTHKGLTGGQRLMDALEIDGPEGKTRQELEFGANDLPQTPVTVAVDANVPPTLPQPSERHRKRKPDSSIGISPQQALDSRKRHGIGCPANCQNLGECTKEDSAAVSCPMRVVG